MSTRTLQLGCTFRYSSLAPTAAVFQVAAQPSDTVSIKDENWTITDPRDMRALVRMSGAAALPASVRSFAACAVSSDRAARRVSSGVRISADFPASFPLPPGTVITSEERRCGGRIILHTVAPSDYRSVALFCERELPAAFIRRCVVARPGVAADGLLNDTVLADIGLESIDVVLISG